MNKINNIMDRNVDSTFNIVYTVNNFNKKLDCTISRAQEKQPCVYGVLFM